MIANNNNKSNEYHKFSGIKKLNTTPGEIYNFEEKYKPYLWKNYKTLGVSIIKCEEYIWPNIPSLPANATNDQKTRHKKIIENQQDKINKYEDDKTAIIGDMIEHLDESSLSILQVESRFEEYQNKNDPISLWKLIKEKHETSGAEMRAQKIQERRILREMIQNENESIEEFIKRYRKQLNRVKAAKVTLDNDTIVADFLQNIGKRFIKCKMEIYSKPVELIDFDQASKYVIAWDKTQKAIIDDPDPENFDMINSLRNKPERQGWIPDDIWAKMTENERKLHQMRNKSKFQANKRLFQRKYVKEPCLIHTGLGEFAVAATHETDKCKLKQEINNIRDQRKRQKINHINESSSSSNGIKIVSEKQNLTNEYDINFGFMVRYKSNFAKDEKSIWIIDSGASTNVVNSTKQLENITKRNSNIESIGGKMDVEWRGDHCLFGECLFVPTSKVNLISLSKSKNIFDIEYDKNRDEFVLKHKKNKNINLVFKNVNNVYQLYFNVLNELSNEKTEES